MHAHRLLGRICPLLVAVAGLAVFAAAGPARAQEQVTVDVGDFWYCNASFEEGTCETVIDAGDTVVWDFSSGLNSHTVTDCGASCDDATSSPLFDSDIVAPGGSFSFTFDDAGAFPYYCTVHPTLMFGRIVVQPAAAAPSPTPVLSTQEPGDIIPPGSTPLGGLPTSGQGTHGDATSPWFALAALAVSGALLTLLGATAYRRSR